MQISDIHAFDQMRAEVDEDLDRLIERDRAVVPVFGDDQSLAAMTRAIQRLHPHEMSSLLAVAIRRLSRAPVNAKEI